MHGEERENEKKGVRMIILTVVFCVICAVFIMRLVRLQLIEGIKSNVPVSSAQTQTTERRVKLQAVRGQIYDCNGRVLVSNSYSYAMYLDYDAMPYTRAEWNDTLLVVRAALSAADENENMTLPESLYCLEGIYPSLRYTDEAMDYGSSVYNKIVEKIQTDEFYSYYIKKHKVTETGSDGELTLTKEALVGIVTPLDIAEYYIKKYELDKKDDEGNELYTNEEKTILMSEYYRLEDCTFGLGDRVLLAQNVTLGTMAYVEEARTKGVAFEISYSRVYEYPGIASHILGRIGKIYAEDWDYYNELGYSMDAVVGISGCEYAFEQYLHGQDGVMVIVEDMDGNTVDKYVESAAIPGRDVYLTIDIELQMAAEEALAQAVLYTVDSSNGQGTLSGEDCDAGAIVAVTNDGAVRAIASYPTYDLSLYNQSYESLSKDEKNPLYNRALQGLYAPGSTFKPGVALAALAEGVISIDTEIYCSGVYDRFSDYKPTCWIYNMYGRIHGSDDVVRAIRDSCNCFFYETGYLLGIEKMNKYCKIYGLGSHTGIELYEETGILAGPEYRDDNGLSRWVLGDTVAAAIGQSNNVFNPLQIAMYTSFIANNGQRYAAHLLDSTYVFGADEPDYVKEPQIIDALEIKQEYLDAVHKGMYEVINDAAINYTSYRHFMNLDVKVAGKTGTAQVSRLQSNNAVMTCYAPYESPELIVTCVLERGNSGSNCGKAIAAVYEKYFETQDGDRDNTETQSADNGQ